VSVEDILNSIDRNLAGIKRNLNLLPGEKKRISLHEAGHALVAWYLKHSNPVLKISIIPRSMGSLGFTQMMPKESSLMTSEELIDMAVTLCGGRAAEEVYIGTYSNGAIDDLRKIHSVLSSYVKKFGMSDKLKNLYLEEDQGQFTAESSVSQETKTVYF
jgi:AFG3 family protein